MAWWLTSTWTKTKFVTQLKAAILPPWQQQGLKKTWDKAVTVAGDVEKFGKAGKTALKVGEFFIKLLS